MPRPTGRGFALLGLAAATYLAGRVVGTWELYLVGLRFPGRGDSSPGCWSWRPAAVSLSLARSRQSDP